MVQAMQHQRRAIPKMLSGNVMLVWDPGTGKTYPVLMAAQFLADPVLAIVPAHLRDQWEDQAREHAPLLNVQILDKLAQPFEWQFQDLVICSYEYASHLPRWRELRQIKWGALAIDEAHYLMNLDANRSRALLGAKMGETHGLVFAADYVWPLTGTPFTFPNQIYPILSRLFPDAIKRPARNGPGLMTAREWENEFCIVAPGDKGFGEKSWEPKTFQN
jgi:superfamily II DNA or RNA helicase